MSHKTTKPHVMPIPSPKELKEQPWFIKNWSNRDRATFSPEALHLTCIPGKVGMEGGTGFRALPLLKFPTNHLVYEYEVFFPEDFNFVKGGKLPGMGLGSGTESATGGDWKKDAGSVRIMWRERGQAIVYVYFPLQISKKGTRDGTITVQNAAFEKAADGSLGKHAGIDVFFKHRAGLKFKKGEWNTVRLDVKLNTPGKRDGVLSTTINGETRSVDGVIFRNDPELAINMVLSQTFFGGSTKEWAAKKTETISFRNFRFTWP